MKPEESNRVKCTIDEIIEYNAEIRYKEEPVAAEALQCPDCAQLQPEEQEGLPGEDNAQPAEATVAAEAPQCPSCSKLQPEDVLKLYCSCSPQKGPDQGIPNSPQQVLADYNSRHPVLINTSGRRPANVVAKPNNTQTGRPVYAAPRLCNCRKSGR